MSDSPPVIDNPWAELKRFTAARIALGRSGASQPTAAQLAFQLAHAQARDAVHTGLDAPALLEGLADQGHATLLLHSAAADRATYLQRPDLGRQLDAPSRALLREAARGDGHDLAVVLADGLSARAIDQNALPFLAELTPLLVRESWALAPVTLVLQGRVAVGDEVAQLLGARAVLVLIGERPGLSSPDSMGLYLTWAPRIGTRDAERNCVSNVRPTGMSFAQAAHKLHYLLGEARRRGISGVALKDETTTATPGLQQQPPGFLLG
ncbi:ethanolamine ammonia-lyase light chain [Pseudoduganella lurida]|uniref:Ethanolamine ammonia-lyase small subunit n=1 Tax=Pseudoduganella lurida TaxID=1036180 RepID=A0A562QZA9_9BURK|nr:ethanolamine ammonia-lyase subunit EutC [Pseudoduganella lurida]TWI61476.1 ethanolamine ammonia-lyase light chain [Pseudoduganella lurida]